MSIFAALPTMFILPDLVSHCDFRLRINRHHRQATAESKRWLFRGDNLNQKSRKAIHGLKAGRLTSMCYPDAGFPQLRVCCDFLTYLFHLDNLSDDMDNAGTKAVADVVLNSLYHPYRYYSPARLNRMTKDFYRRMLPTASGGTCRRFIETMDLFFQAVHLQAIDRANGVVPDLESYISQRRDTSGCKPCWALIEYANNLDIPDEVMEHPIIQSLGEAANDLVTWSNDIFSYNVEQSKGDTHNMICVVMHEQQLDLQSAVDFVGELCKRSIDRFNEDRKLIPSWGTKIDKDMAVYVRGLADWIVGSLHWSFESTRYFQNVGQEVKRTRVVNLLPPRRHLITHSPGEYVNDSLARSNDMSSCDVEQPTQDTIPVVMHEQQITHERQIINEKVVYEQQFMPEEQVIPEKRVIPEHWLDLQSVADFAGKLSKDVSVYVRGLVGSWNWSFNSTPYFQNSGRKVETTGVVNLVPERKPDRQIMQSLGDAADTWSNEKAFYVAEQSNGDMIPDVINEKHGMYEQQLGLQSAVDFAGKLCKQSLDRFNESRKLIPSWGSKIDKEVSVYVCDLAYRIVGGLNRSFGSMRCIHHSGREVRMARVINLLPRTDYFTLTHW